MVIVMVVFGGVFGIMLLLQYSNDEKVSPDEPLTDMEKIVGTWQGCGSSQYMTYTFQENYNLSIRCGNETVASHYNHTWHIMDDKFDVMSISGEKYRYMFENERLYLQLWIWDTGYIELER